VIGTAQIFLETKRNAAKCDLLELQPPFFPFKATKSAGKKREKKRTKFKRTNKREGGEDRRRNARGGHGLSRPGPPVSSKISLLLAQVSPSPHLMCQESRIHGGVATGDVRPWVSRSSFGSCSFWVRISSDLGALEGLTRVFLDSGRISLDFGCDLASELLCLILSVLPCRLGYA